MSTRFMDRLKHLAGGGKCLLEKMKHPLNFIKTHTAVFVPVGILLAGLLASLFVFLVAIWPWAQEYTVRTSLGELPIVASEELQNGEEIQQPFWLENGLSLQGFELTFGTYRKVLQDITISGSLVNSSSGKEVASFSHLMKNIKDNASFGVDFSSAVQLSPGEYELVFHFEGLEKGERLSLWLSDNNEKLCFVGGDAQPASLLLNMYSDSLFLVPYYWALAGTLAVFLAAFWVLVFVVKAKPQNLFLAAAAVLGILYMFVNLPYAFPDSRVHVRKALYYSDKLLGAETTERDGRLGWNRRMEDSLKGLTLDAPQRTNYEHIYSNFFDSEAQPGATIKKWVDDYGFAAQYAIPTLGVTLAKLLGMGQVATLYMGQFFNLAAFIAAFYFIIRLVPFKTFFCLLGLTPFVLYISGTYSYDVPINTLSFAFIGIVLHLCYQKEKVTWPYAVLLAAIALLLAPQKLIYIPLLFLAVLIPARKWTAGSRWCQKHTPAQNRWRKYLVPTLVVAAVLALVGIASFELLQTQMAGFSQEAGSAPWADVTYTYQLLLVNPAEFLRLVGITALDTAGYIFTAGTDILYYPLPVWVMVVIAFLYVASLSPVRRFPLAVVPPRHKITMGILCLLIYGMGLVAALTWTGIDSYYIGNGGIQGRYFIPLYPLIALLACGIFQRQRDNDRSLIYTIAVLNAYGILGIFQRGVFS